jgi:hypothetical protein
MNLIFGVFEFDFLQETRHVRRACLHHCGAATESSGDYLLNVCSCTIPEVETANQLTLSKLGLHPRSATMWSWAMADNGTFSTPERTLIDAVQYLNRTTAYVTLSIALILFLFNGFKRNGSQQLAPGIMVVGGNEKQTIMANRERFRENAKEMLQEGYRKVC